MTQAPTFGMRCIVRPLFASTNTSISSAPTSSSGSVKLDFEVKAGQHLEEELTTLRENPAKNDPAAGARVATIESRS